VLPAATAEAATRSPGPGFGIRAPADKAEDCRCSRRPGAPRRRPTFPSNPLEIEQLLDDRAQRIDVERIELVWREKTRQAKQELRGTASKPSFGSSSRRTREKKKPPYGGSKLFVFLLSV